MAEGTGRIVDFTKPNQDQLPNMPTPAPQIKRVDMSHGVEVPEVRLHEQLVIEGTGKVRQKDRKPEDPEIRLRITDGQSWERVKRMEDE